MVVRAGEGYASFPDWNVLKTCTKWRLGDLDIEFEVVCDGPYLVVALARDFLVAHIRVQCSNPK